MAAFHSAAITYNSNAQNHDSQKYVFDFYKCNPRIESTITANDTVKALAMAQCEIDNTLMVNVLAAIYPEIIQAFSAAIASSLLPNGAHTSVRTQEDVCGISIFLKYFKKINYFKV
ncbi:MAG: hypothetical protein IJK92_05740 [Bacteroidales bacterium]|nr:hypothetical protein [Bacteroidales bacterium]